MEFILGCYDFVNWFFCNMRKDKILVFWQACQFLLTIWTIICLGVTILSNAWVLPSEKTRSLCSCRHVNSCLLSERLYAWVLQSCQIFLILHYHVEHKFCRYSKAAELSWGCKGAKWFTLEEAIFCRANFHCWMFFFWYRNGAICDETVISSWCWNLKLFSQHLVMVTPLSCLSQLWAMQVAKWLTR